MSSSVTLSSKDRKVPSIIITTKECLQNRTDSSITSVTKKPLNERSINGVYTKLVKDCDDENSFNKILRARNAIRKTLIPVLNRMDTIENRIKFSKIVKEYTKNVESCLTKSTTTGNLLTLVEKTGNDIIRDMIQYDKRIGSESAYGIVYSNVGQNLMKMITFSSKIMIANDSSLEIELLQKMSELVEHKKTPHMPIIYRILKCKKRYDDIMKEQGISEYEEPHRLILYGSYYIVMNELADYDLGHFFKNAHTNEIYESVLMQVFIALHTFHKYTKYLHNDAHWGNFLIHKIKEGGYWHYKINDINLYVPNLGYLVVLWDPGLAKSIKSYNKPIRDFSSIYNFILYKREEFIVKNLPVIPEDILKSFGMMNEIMSNEKDSVNAFANYFTKISSDGTHLFNTVLINPTPSKEPKKNIINSDPYLL